MSSTEDAGITRCVTDQGLMLTLRGALFLYGRAEINPDSPLLQRVLAVLRGYPDCNISIEAHTDSLGSASYNYDLTQRCADSVKLYLAAHGIALPRITALGKGASRPVASNHSAAGRQQNSRLEIIVHIATATD